MHPQTFIKTFWKREFKPQIFVAMSFNQRYKARYEGIFVPAINGINYGGVPLQPYRVDISKSGDSILTEIMDGIAHSQMVLADLSSVGKDSVTGIPYRNSNVMYEVGIALASRQSSEVLLVRDDEDKFLFDVSTVPHLKMDFSDKLKAVIRLRNELIARLNERNFMNDARAKIAISGLSSEEVIAINSIPDLSEDKIWGFRKTGTVNFNEMIAI